MLKKLLSNNKRFKGAFKGSELLAALTFSCLANLAHSQNSPLSSGTEFLSTYFDAEYQITQASNLSGYDTNIFTNLFVVGVNEACVRVKVYGMNYEQIFYVAKDSLINIRLPNNRIYLFETPTNRAISIKSNAPVGIVQGTNIGKGAKGGVTIDQSIISQAEAICLLPTSANDLSYYSYFISAGGTITNFVGRSLGNTPTVYILVNNESATSGQLYFNHRTLLPPNSIVSIPADTTIFFSLDPGHIKSFWSNSSIGNGSISANFLTNSTQSILKLFILPLSLQSTINSNDGVGLAYEETKPPGFAGTRFFCAPLAGNYGNQYSIFAAKDSTVVNFGGLQTVVLDSLQRFDTIFQGPMHISSSQPVYGFLTPWASSIANDNYYSPFAVTMSSTKELITESLFCTLDEPDTLNNYIVDVVCKTSAVGLCKLDGQVLSSSLFTPFPQDSSWSWANISLAKGVHKLQNDSGFHAHQYTWFKSDTPGVLYPSYGYNLAQSIIWPQDSFVFRAGLTPNSLAPFANANPSLCPGQPLYLQASHLRHTTWQWSFADGTTQTQRVGNQRAQPKSHTWKTPGQYWVTVADSAGCSNGDSLLVIVDNGPLAGFSYTASTGCSGTFVQLQNVSMGATNYQWQWPGGSSTQPNPGFVYAGQDSTITVTLVATDGTCSDTLTQNLKLQTSNFKPQTVPNVITPNQDGVNDAFCIPNTGGYQDCYKLEIFSRWGNLVYTSQNPQDCWQPEGNIAPGVYFYVLTLGQHQYSGQVTVVD